jgi:hypothetical protein
MPSRTPSNGLERANQNETFQPEPWALGFVFTLFSQAYDDRHFTNTRNSFRDALSAARRMRRALQSPRSVEKSEQFELLHQIVFEDEIHPLAIMRCFVTETATVQPSWFLLANAR